MHKSTNGNRPSAQITDEEITQVIAEQLPRWKAACDNTQADMVIIQQAAFNRSLDDILLLHAAIRYAGIKGKTVMIAPYEIPEPIKP